MSSMSGTKPRAAIFTWMRLILFALAMILQLALFVVVVMYFSRNSTWIFTAHVVISAIVVIGILSSSMKPEYKLAWTIPILLMPVIGGVFYLLYGRSHFRRWERVALIKSWARSRHALRHKGEPSLVPNEPDEPRIQIKPSGESWVIHPGPRRQEHYLRTAAHYPSYKDTHVTYYPIGEKAWRAMLAELEKAERYIFFQYFIISAGQMWSELHEVLARKAAAGVDVRVLYDDVGSLFTIPSKFEETLKSEGIKVQAINPFGLRMLLRYNNRNHAKILVVDGKVGFTGGLNIGDEYVNITSPYGHWKDTAVRLVGPAVYSLAVMFATVWNSEKDGLDWDVLPALEPSASDIAQETQTPTHGWVQPYDDTPFDDLNVGQDAYLTMLSSAKNTVDITSPYLIVDAQVTGALIRAARSGVRVRIITPHIGDSFFVHETTRSSYRGLVDAGVEIYEYEPGYIHAKMMIADGESAIIGTINLDYRSLHLHQECGVWLYQVPAIADMAADYEATLEKCIPIAMEDCLAVPWYRRAMRAVLRTFAPLM